MSPEELIKIQPKKILRDEKLTRRYIEIYTAFFGKAPSCTGCSINKDINRLKNAIFDKDKKLNKMEKRKFKLKTAYNGQILSFKKDSRTFHSYGRVANDEFLKDFIQYGMRPKSEEDRKKMFSILEEDKETENDLLKLKREELNKILEEKGLNPDDYKNKKEAIEAIKDE